MSEPRYLSGDDYAHNGTEDDVDEDIDPNELDEMWEDLE